MLSLHRTTTCVDFMCKYTHFSKLLQEKNMLCYKIQKIRNEKSKSWLWWPTNCINDEWVLHDFCPFF